MDIFSLLRLAKANGASDLNLIESIPPLLRVNGPLEVLNGAAPLTAGEINQAFLQISTPEEREHFHHYLELDFACSLPDIGRLRCNAAQQRWAISLAVRLLPAEVPTIDVIRTHKEIGMITLDEALVDLYLRQIIIGETLLSVCNDRREVERLIGTIKEK